MIIILFAFSIKIGKYMYFDADKMKCQQLPKFEGMCLLLFQDSVKASFLFLKKTSRQEWETQAKEIDIAQALKTHDTDSHPKGKTPTMQWVYRVKVMTAFLCVESLCKS